MAVADQATCGNPAHDLSAASSHRGGLHAEPVCCETAQGSDAEVVDFDQLAGADLVVDRIYRGGSMGGTRDDPLSKLLDVGNQGGFRPAGSPTKDSVKLAVLYTTGSEP